MTVTDPVALERTFDLGSVSGSLRDLGTDGIAITEKEAAKQNLTTGDRTRLTFTDGRQETFTVRAVYGQSELAGDYVVTREAWAPHRTQDADTLVAVSFKDGVGADEGKAAVERVADQYGNPDVQTRDEYAQSSAGGIDMMLTLVYALLALAVLIALLGIANTLTLAIHERTRELGLLRAVGQTRSQLRAMVRWESVLVAAFGTAGGLALGAFLGWVWSRPPTGRATAPSPSRCRRSNSPWWPWSASRPEPWQGCAPHVGRPAWTYYGRSPPNDTGDDAFEGPLTARSADNGRPGGSMLGPAQIDRRPDLREPTRRVVRRPALRRSRGRGPRRHGRREREPHDLPGLAVRTHTPALADGGHHREPATAGGECVGGPDVRHDRQSRVVVAHRDHEPVEQQLDLHGAHLVRPGVLVDVGQQLGHTERGAVYQRVQMPVAQLRRYDSADLTDPRRQGLELHRAVPAWVTDHGCDSPTEEVRKNTEYG